MIVNVGGTDDELVGATSPAGEVEITGVARIPGRYALAVVAPGDEASASESATPPSESSEPSESSSGSSAPETTGSSQPPSSSESEAPSSSTTSTDAAPELTATLTETPAPNIVGTISIVITGLTGDLPYGKTVPVTFEFARAGKVTISMPVGAPATPRPEGRDETAVEGASEGH
jgi:hypothetical protein